MRRGSGYCSLSLEPAVCPLGDSLNSSVRFSFVLLGPWREWGVRTAQGMHIFLEFGEGKGLVLGKAICVDTK